MNEEEKEIDLNKNDDMMKSNDKESKNGRIDKIYLQIPKKKIATLIRIIEGYDNVGIVTTENAQEGLVAVQLTPDTEITVREILRNLSFVQIINDEDGINNKE
ncbi:MAG: DUF4911 domain-containing protein [Clostridia bacterium]|nr:DUF4911 domain-containing protein [Clostridia bacterium]